MHAYFNVYTRAVEGWKNFLLRRSAVRRLNSLKSATDEELEEYDDVCSICFDEMISAKVTKCNHFFHSMCLRKWLYVQDKCPMCHTDILSEDWLLPVLQRMAAVGWQWTSIDLHLAVSRSKWSGTKKEKIEINASAQERNNLGELKFRNSVHEKLTNLLQALAPKARDCKKAWHLPSGHFMIKAHGISWKLYLEFLKFNSPESNKENLFPVRRPLNNSNFCNYISLIRHSVK